MLYLYLIVLSLLPYLVIKQDRSFADERHKALVLFQVLGFASLYLVFGGYSIDAWRYLTRFTHNPLGFDEEWLFWLAGNFLSGVLPNPWPVKVLSALAVALWVWAVIRAIGLKRKETLVFGLALLPLMPAFFFTMGNAIRQGLASVIILHAIVYLVSGKRWRFGLLSVVGLIAHQVGLVFVIAGAAMRIPRKAIWLFLIMAPCVSFGLSEIFELWDINLADYIRYAQRDDGQFHYLKFAAYFSLSIALLGLSSIRVVPNQLFLLTNAFAVTVGLASLLLRYEVPFERILLYADVLLPIIIAMVLAELRVGARTKQVLWGGALCAGLLLWTSGAVNRTLTGGVTHVEDGRIESYQIPNSELGGE